MNFVNCDMGLKLNLLENTVNVLVIEEPKILRNFIEHLFTQFEGSDGPFVLSNEDKPISIAKNMEFVFNPYKLDFDNKKIQSKLYQQLKEILEDNLDETAMKLNQTIIEFFDSSFNLVPFNLEFNLELDLIGLFKLYGVAYHPYESGFLENIIEYLRMVSILLNIESVILFDIKSFLSKDELKKLYEFSFYNKLNLILLESSIRDKLDSEIITIIDADCCIIPSLTVMK